MDKLGCVLIAFGGVVALISIGNYFAQRGVDRPRSIAETRVAIPLALGGAAVALVGLILIVIALLT